MSPVAEAPKPVPETTELVESYGSGPTISKLAERLSTVYTSLFPGSERLAPQEAVALAQTAYMLRLNPFNREIMYLKSDSRTLGVYIGVHGYRAIARRVVKQADPNAFLDVRFRLVSPDELDLNDSDKADVMYAVVCTATDSTTMRNWIRLRKEARDAGLPQDRIDDIFSLTPPNTVGVGIVWKREAATFAKSHVNPRLQAEIRAERAALRARYGADLPVVVDAEWAPEEAVKDYVEAEAEDVVEPTGNGKDKSRFTPEQAEKADAALGIEHKPKEKEAKK